MVCYLDSAKTESLRGDCLRRNYGCVIVKDNIIVSTGYTHIPTNRKSCSTIGSCIRNIKNIPSGSNYELCRSVHAEMDAIIKCSKSDLIGATLYLYGYDLVKNKPILDALPCLICERLIIESGITKIINSVREIEVVDLINNDKTLFI